MALADIKVRHFLLQVVMVVSQDKMMKDAFYRPLFTSFFSHDVYRLHYSYKMMGAFNG